MFRAYSFSGLLKKKEKNAVGIRLSLWVKAAFGGQRYLIFPVLKRLTEIDGRSRTKLG